MSRYFTKARMVDHDGWAVSPGRPWLSSEPSRDEILCGIEVSDHEATETGLLDEHGNSIWRAPLPIGFGKNEEWQ